MEQIYVGEGEFIMGTEDDDSKQTPTGIGGVAWPEGPEHPVWVHSFWIDKYEVTNAQYTICVNGGACKPPLMLDAPQALVAAEPFIGRDYYTDPDYANYPVVYVDFYASSHGQDYGDTDLLASPGSFGFYLRESFGYSLNGKQFQVAHGETYTSVQDAFEGTTAKILGGTNGNTETDYLTRPLTKTVNTGWSAPSAQDSAVVASNILSLWGLADNLSLYDENLTGYLPSAAENNKSDVYALSMTYDDARVNGLHLGTAGFRLATKDTDGKWIKAVDKNYGGGKKFVKGPCQPGYPLGTYGVDTATKTAWAVINYNSDFAVIAQYE